MRFVALRTGPFSQHCDLVIRTVRFVGSKIGEEKTKPASDLTTKRLCTGQDSVHAKWPIIFSENGTSTQRQEKGLHLSRLTNLLMEESKTDTKKLTLTKTLSHLTKKFSHH